MHAPSVFRSRGSSPCGLEFTVQLGLVLLYPCPRDGVAADVLRFQKLETQTMGMANRHHNSRYVM